MAIINTNLSVDMITFRNKSSNQTKYIRILLSNTSLNKIFKIKLTVFMTTNNIIYRIDSIIDKTISVQLISITSLNSSFKVIMFLCSFITSLNSFLFPFPKNLFFSFTFIFLIFWMSRILTYTFTRCGNFFFLKFLRIFTNKSSNRYVTIT